MRRLLTILLTLTIGLSYGQNTNATNTKFTNGLAVPDGATNKPTSGLTAGAMFYKTGVGLQVYTGTVWLTLGEAGAGVTSFNSRTGAVVPLFGDYSSFFVPLTRTLTINGTTQDLSADRTFTVTTGNITGLQDSLSKKANRTFDNVASGAIANSKLANSSITFASPGSSGLAPNWSSSPVSLGGTATLNIPMAATTGVTAGLISKAQYDSFLTLGALSATSPLVYNSGTGSFSLAGLTGLGTSGYYINSTGSGWQYRSPAQVLSDIGAAPATGSLSYIQNQISSSPMTVQSGKIWLSDSIKTSGPIIAAYGRLAGAISNSVGLALEVNGGIQSKGLFINPNAFGAPAVGISLESTNNVFRLRNLNNFTADFSTASLTGSRVITLPDQDVTGATGTGAFVLSISPTLVTPALGTPSALVGTNITGAASGLSIGGSAPAGSLTGSTLASNVTASSLTSANLATLTATNSTLTFSGSYNGNTSRTVGLNLANANTWTAAQSVSVNSIANGLMQFSSAAGGTMQPYALARSEATTVGFRVDASRASNVSSATGYSIAAHMLNTDFNATTGNLFSVSNDGVSKVSVDYNGVITSGGLANGTVATTQSAGDNSTKLATTAYADAVAFSGTYTPVVSDAGSATTTVRTTDYFKIGSRVIVSGAITVNRGVASSFGFDLSLPPGATSNFASQYDARGGGSTDATVPGEVYIEANTSDDEVTFTGNAFDPAGGICTVYYQFSYTIL